MEPETFEKIYRFKLDDFQKEAITHLSNGKSVLVSAPTGSGKTVVAECALEIALEKELRFFYTSPLKALSNQKFRDFLLGYDSVGLLTGDNSINGDSHIVVMTTEVLRNMIYEESPFLHNLGVVVLDEIHYMQDPIRGSVWEEIVILLPREVKIVALSATVSNAGAIAGWMNSIRGDVELVEASKRPVELKDFYFVGKALKPLFSKALPKVITEQLTFLKKEATAKESRRMRRSVDLKPSRHDVVSELRKRDMLPLIYFLFSKQACDDTVSDLISDRVRLTTEEERTEITNYLKDKFSAVDPYDLECLDYSKFKKGILSGFAAHHAGHLPLFKEAVEELFCAGLIKVVFATETLSLGINMPARSVV
ncbi:MAG: DEAD/DEAH box helicase, partial [Actinomycetota bacterium]|nr:DEAD/DEAH box helicase [Actinomycetota bacterium]